MRQILAIELRDWSVEVVEFRLFTRIDTFQLLFRSAQTTGH